MKTALSFALPGLPDDTWMGPIIGAVVFLLAFLLGWRFLVARSRKAGAEPDGPFDTTFLQGITRERRCAPRRRGNTVEVELANGSKVFSARSFASRSVSSLPVRYVV